MTTRTILPFSSAEAPLALAGGKGANLVALARAGYSVPPFFVVTTEAYRSFVQAHDLESLILEISASCSVKDPATFERASSQISALYSRASMPEQMANEIVEAYRELGRTDGQTEASLAVAVRSSATAEDLPGLAFAGQQETYLNVVGEPQVLEAVKRCWGSLWTARAMAYRAHNGIPADEIALAVVVQQMIPSDSAGVLFTANPLTGRRDEIVIDASFGLGEALVSGRVAPDHYVVDPHTWVITERRLGEKALSIVAREGGGTEEITEARAGEQALSDGQIVELAQTGWSIAVRFQFPQDIEWAYSAGHLSILQARPITSLYPVPESLFPDPGLRVYFSLNSIQGVTDPLTPLGATTLGLFVGGGFTRLFRLTTAWSDYIRTAGDRLFIDATDLARDPQLRQILMGLFARGDPGALASFKDLVKAGRIPFKPSLTPRRMLQLAPRVAPVLRRLIATLANPEWGRRTTVDILEEIVEEERRQLQSAKTLSARIEMMQTRLPIVFAGVVRTAIPTLFPALYGLTVIDRWLQEWVHARPGTSLELMRGLAGNVTSEMDLELWHAAQEIRRDSAAAQALSSKTADALVEEFRRGALPAPAQRALQNFLNRYGMRAIAEIDLGRPRWRDDPSPILSTLLGYLKLSDPELSPDVVFARGRTESETRAAELIAAVRQTRSGRVRARMLRAAIRRLRLLGGLRELPKFKMIQVLDLYRTALIEGAKELVSTGRLDRAEDIFFLPFESLRRASRGETIDLRETVRAERANYERERTRRQMPRLLLSTGEAFYEGVRDSTAGALELAGDPVSPGVAEGRVRVVLDPRGDRLEPGEILVCPATDPGWTPLFLTASGLVMEIGGLVTHGAVVAREYGIPAVVGIHNATSRLATGQRVRVDGNTGRVTILQAREPEASSENRTAGAPPPKENA